MSYPTGVPITYTAVASTPGRSSDTYSYAWTFDDGSTGNVASLSHTWNTLGNHAATVVATDIQTGATATASKTVSIVSAPNSLPNTVASARGFSTLAGDVFVALGSGDEIYQFNKLLVNGSTAKISTQAYQDSSNHSASNNGDCSAAISPDGVWIVYAGITGASVANFLTAINTSTGVVHSFDMHTVGATCDPSPGASVMIIARGDGKFAVSIARTAAATQYTFIYDPSTNTASNVVNGTYAYISGIVIKADDGNVYALRKSYGGNTIAKYNIAGNSWSAATLASTQYDGSTRVNPSIVKMADGKFMFIGGSSSGSAVVNTAIFDPSALTITDKANLNTARFWPSVALLPSGKILAAGGRVSTSGAGLSSAEIYDPVADTWTSLALGMSQARGAAPITKLPSGNFCIVGGYDTVPAPTATVEYFHPGDNRFYSVD